MKGDNIANRLLEFAAAVLATVEDIAQVKTRAAKHIESQLIRSATAGGAHYAEARRGESAADFAHKVLVAAKETGESAYWLKLAQRARLIKPSHDVSALIREASELTAILVASARTARNHAK
jgi:four helix bundle protein